MNFDIIIKQCKKYLLSRAQERRLMFVFGCLLFSVFARLFSLQIVSGSHYSQLLMDQHYSQSTLDAKRGNIYVVDRSQKKMQLTQNITVYNLFVDPNFLPNKTRFIQDFGPILYEHFCVLYGMKQPSSVECIHNIENFIGKQILPERNILFYGSEELSGGLGTGMNQYTLDIEHEQKVQDILQSFSKEKAINLIQTAMDEKIYTGMKLRNYLGTINDPSLISMFSGSERNFLSIENDTSVYINPKRIQDGPKVKGTLANISEKYHLGWTSFQIQRACRPQNLNYVKLASGIHGSLAGRMRTLKERGIRNEKGEQKKFEVTLTSVDGKPRKMLVPLYHGVGLEESHQRYYPYGSFMAQILGYLDDQGKGHYGVEEYFQSLLAGKSGKIIGLSASLVGKVGSNDLEVEDPENGKDVTLTIDPVVQKEVESMTQKATTEFNADGIAVTIIDPYSGKIKAMVSTPSFNPNSYTEVLKLKPVTVAERGYIDDDSRMEYPMFSMSGKNLVPVTSSQRKDNSLQKYMFSNGFGFLSYLNRNISFPYEPGSIFKPLTVGIGIDSNSIGLYDYYNDPGKVMVGDFLISNVMSACMGTHTYSHALAFSCNVGMVRIAQQMTKYVFYNYLEKLGFNKKTGIELAGEDSSSFVDPGVNSKAGFYNNTFGQGLLTTPLQMAVAFSSLVNGGTLIQPTIVESIGNVMESMSVPLAKKQKTKIFASSTSENVKDALIEVVRYGSVDKIKRPGFGIGAKSGTSQIARQNPTTKRVVYRDTVGWTNGSAMGMITRDDTRYIIAIQVRRPRTSKWGNDTAVKLLDRIAGFLIEYDYIDI